MDKNYQNMTDSEWKLEQDERKERKLNLVVEGILENTDVKTEDIIIDLFHDLEIDFGVEACVHIFRRGTAPRNPLHANNTDTREDGRTTFKGQRPRQIVVSFKNQSYKAHIFSKIKNLNGKDKWNDIYLNDDHTAFQKSQLADLRSLAQYAKKIGHDARISGFFLIICGRRYAHHELHDLPSDITLEKAKTQDVDKGKGIAFQSKHSLLSNLSRCDIVYDKIDFKSAESAYQYVRATYCGSTNDVFDQLTAIDAYESRSRAHDLQDNIEWIFVREHVMKDILLYKFKHNPYHRSKLIATYGKVLYEACTDKFWGCGYPITETYNIRENNLKGLNMLGKILMEIREQIIIY